MQTNQPAPPNQQSVKLSVTVKSRLERKYNDAALEKIKAAIADWQKADHDRGIRTVHVEVDNSEDETMKELGVQPVSGEATAENIKKAVDKLWNKLMPDYLVLFGAHDIVPMFEVINPTKRFRDLDYDKNVPTDNPYASSEPFSEDDQNSYLIPDRVIGRIPDMVSDPGDNSRSGDPAWFVDYLETATGWESKDKSVYKDPYVICTSEAKDAGKECVKKAFPTRTLPPLICPPDSDISTAARDRLSSRLHMIKCHGNDKKDATFWGYKNASAQNQEGTWKPALTSATLKARLEPSTVVATMCCYGAQIFSPKDVDTWPLPSTYLRKGALAFVGPTMKAWVGTDEMSGADVIVTYYLKRVLEGDSIGLAFLKSKQDYHTHDSIPGKVLGPQEDKTLIEYILLGDPSIHPVSSLPDSPNALAVQERRQRRVARAIIGEGIRSLVQTRSDATPEEVAKAPQVFASDLAKDAKKNIKEFTIDPTAVQVQKVDVRFPDKFATAKDPVGSRQSLEYHWRGERDRGGDKQLCLLKVETDRTGRPWRASVMYTS
jgi:hypothetical protein